MSAMNRYRVCAFTQHLAAMALILAVAGLFFEAWGVFFWSIAAAIAFGLGALWCTSEGSRARSPTS